MTKHHYWLLARLVKTKLNSLHDDRARLSGFSDKHMRRQNESELEVWNQIHVYIKQAGKL